MRKKTMKLLILAFILASGLAVAQEKPQAEKTIEKSEAKANEKREKKTKKNAVAVYGGLPGFALGYARKLNNHFNLRLSGATFSYNQKLTDVSLGKRKVNLDADLNYRAVDLLIEYLPFKKSSFKLVSGLSWMKTAETEILITPAKDIKYGEIVIPQDQYGEMNVGGDWSGVSPYMALGFGRAIPKHNFGFGFEVGGHFVGKPGFTFDATKSFLPSEEIENERNDFQTWLNDISFIPTFLFHLSYKF